jgi:hypothetical protein
MRRVRVPGRRERFAAGVEQMPLLPRNQSIADRSLRIVLGLLLLALGWFEIVPGVWGIALKLFGWVPLVTGVIGWCPFYSLFSLTTRRSRGRHRPSG